MVLQVLGVPMGQEVLCVLVVQVDLGSLVSWGSRVSRAPGGPPPGGPGGLLPPGEPYLGGYLPPPGDPLPPGSPSSDPSAPL